MLTIIINRNRSVRKFVKIINAIDAECLESGDRLIIGIFIKLQWIEFYLDIKLDNTKKHIEF